MIRKILFWGCLFFIPWVSFSQVRDKSDSWESLRARPYPQWFSDAKLGVMIHWGVYSVPSYGGAESYAEWFLRGMMAGSPLRQSFVKKVYGENFTYRDFAPLWKAELWNPDEWAEIFKKSGAGYIVLVSKHHDGFCLWPSKYAPQWNSMEIGPHRDIVGELGQAVRKKGLRFGLYYSLPEWGHPLHRWYDDPPETITPYVEKHMIPQFKELISKYKPDLLFTDGEWYNTAEQWHARELISWYYRLVGPDAIVNDRWGHGADIGFRTPEYSSAGLITDRPWAEVRGIGRSFGLNRNEKLSAYITGKDLIHLFVRTVAYGGGLMLNVGPAADGKIPLIQQERLEQLGQWLSINGEAIYGSRPWRKFGEEKQVELRRTDSLINFDWVRNSPGYPIIEDHFTAEWKGFILPPITGKYVFTAQCDDGLRLWIDGKLVLDKWNVASEGNESEAMRENLSDNHLAEYFFEKNKAYPIRVEYREEVQNASVSLSWKRPDSISEVIPASAFRTQINSEGEKGLEAVYRSKRQYLAYTTNHGNLYAICFEWPDNQLILPVDKPSSNTQVTLLGRLGILPWKWENGKLIINTSSVKYNEMPGHDAWTFKISPYDK
ncbi:MAG: alpha-L-fucosidase [Bacteroidales bacterium]|jgi:alpha-L-fucosidase|nr:alpha-L-fucosidase [Bacteroidales bacterium]MDN5330624.1 alpha-L-fucosidase [Bacteroidales bacterium]